MALQLSLGQLPIITDDPVAVSSAAIDNGELTESFNRIWQKASVITDDIAVVESFSHMIAFRTGDGLVCFDASGTDSGPAVVDALRVWSGDPVRSLVFTHGHIDHVGGSGAVAADAEQRGHQPPDVVAHDAVRSRFERYQLTNDWNNHINARQFGGISKRSKMGIGFGADFLPSNAMWPTIEYSSTHTITAGDTDFQLFHDRGETDDHTWAWIPEHRAICAGDFVTWVFPNCGNPQKVQRYPAEWAAALRKMDALGAEYLFGAHGLPVHGADRVHLVLDSLASALESLVEQTLQMMNNGESLDSIIHAVSLPDDAIKPWMLPVYDEPEFIVRNLWRLYGGWWDQDPSNLKPAPRSAVATEVAAMAGGTSALVERALALISSDIKVACHLIEFAVLADPSSTAAHGARAEIYQQRRNGELSLMSKGIFAAAANESRAIVEDAPKSD